VQANADDNACQRHIDDAARAYDVPDGLLDAIAHAESGWRGGPWPWTLNVAGDAEYHDTRADARRRVAAHTRRGHDNIAIGCMQIHLHYHGEAVDRPTDFLDPRRNVMYAARFLHRLHDKTGSWTKAVGRYHAGAGNPKAKRDYICRVLRYHTQLNYSRVTPAMRDYCPEDTFANLDGQQRG